MSCTTINDVVEIHCDSPGCTVTAPPASEIAKGFGLIRMGWHCAGGTHLCPAHPHPEAAATARYGL